MNKIIKNYWAIVAFSFAIISFSCNTSTSVGSDLLSQDELNVAFIDTFKITTATVREDSVLVQAPDYPQSSYPIGIMDDPIMGAASAGVYVEFIRGTVATPKELLNITIDSMILSMQYDTTAYGDVKSSPRSLEVYRLEKTIPTSNSNIINNNNTFSTASYSVYPTPIGVRNNFIPAIKWNSKADSVKITTSIFVDKTKTDSLYPIKLTPHLRIPLNISLAKEILAYDSLGLNDDVEFNKRFKGLFIKPTSKNKNMLNFFLTNATLSSKEYNPQTKITIFFKNSDGYRRFFVMYAKSTAVKLPTYKNELSSRVLNAIANPNSDSLVYLQGLGGTNVKVTIPNLSNLKNKGLIVNKAELECYAPLSTDGLDGSPQLVGTIASNGKGFLIKDAEYGLNSSYKAFGGKPVLVTINGVQLKKYTFNLSYFVQKGIDTNQDNYFYISTNTKPQSVVRTLLYGSKHTKFAPKLKLYYTKVQ